MRGGDTVHKESSLVVKNAGMHILDILLSHGFIGEVIFIDSSVLFSDVYGVFDFKGR
jgi:hypothetical protein